MYNVSLNSILMVYHMSSAKKKILLKRLRETVRRCLEQFRTIQYLLISFLDARV